jgi:hypothetical protein
VQLVQNLIYSFWPATQVTVTRSFTHKVTRGGAPSGQGASHASRTLSSYQVGWPSMQSRRTQDLGLLLLPQPPQRGTPSLSQPYGRRQRPDGTRPYYRAPRTRGSSRRPACAVRGHQRSRLQLHRHQARPGSFLRTPTRLIQLPRLGRHLQPDRSRPHLRPRARHPRFGLRRHRTSRPHLRDPRSGPGS